MSNPNSVTPASPKSPRSKLPLSPRSPRSPRNAIFFGSVKSKKSPLREDSSLLFVKVIEAKDLSTHDDVYCKAFLGQESYRTKVIKAKNNPEWKQDFTFQYVEGEGGNLLIQVWSKKKLMKDHLVGETRIDLNQTFEPESDPVSYPILKEEKNAGSILVYIEKEGRKKTGPKKKAFEAPAAIYSMSWDVEQEKSTLEPSVLLSELKTPDNLLVSGRSSKVGPLKLVKFEMDDVRFINHIFKDEENTVIITLPRDYSEGIYEQKFGVQLKVISPKITTDRCHQVSYNVTKESDRTVITINGRGITKKLKDNIPITGVAVIAKSTLRNAYEQNPLTGFEVKSPEINDKEMFAVEFNREALAKCFERGDDINAFDEEGETLLHKAVTFSDDQELIQFLMDNGANPTKKNKTGKTPIDYAERVFKTQHLQILQSYLSKS